MQWSFSFVSAEAKAELDALPADVRASFERIVQLVQSVGLERVNRVGGGSRPPPAPTERSVQISRTTLFGRGFTALREPAAPGRATAVVVGATGPAP